MFSVCLPCFPYLSSFTVYITRYVTFHITAFIQHRGVTAFIGPSGSGKTTLLRVLNHTYDLLPHARIEGNVLLDGEDLSVFGRNSIETIRLRQRVGLVFQRPNPFPLSIYENIAYGLRLRPELRQRSLDEQIEQVLQNVGLWDEVKDRLRQSALHLAEGQQQLLCLARALSLQPDVLLLDEPCSLLDPVTAHTLETVITLLGQTTTILLITSNPQQALRLAHTTGVLFQGALIDYAPTTRLFHEPRDHRIGTFLHSTPGKRQSEGGQ